MPGLEAYWIEVTSISQNLLSGPVYRPPNCTDFVDKFQCCAENVAIEEKCERRSTFRSQERV